MSTDSGKIQSYLHKVDSFMTSNATTTTNSSMTTKTNDNDDSYNFLHPQHNHLQHNQLNSTRSPLSLTDLNIVKKIEKIEKAEKFEKKNNPKINTPSNILPSLSTTPEWMPKELTERWNVPSTRNLDLAENLNFLTTSTIIHDTNKKDIPNYQQKLDEYYRNLNKEPDLHKLFEPLVESPEPVPVKLEAIDDESSQMKLQVKPDGLRLFDYNTANKTKLNDILNKLRSNTKLDVGRAELIEAGRLSKPKSIKNGASDKEYLKNANTIFKNLQTRSQKVTESIKELTRQHSPIQKQADFSLIDLGDADDSFNQTMDYSREEDSELQEFVDGDLEEELLNSSTLLNIKLSNLEKESLKAEMMNLFSDNLSKLANENAKLRKEIDVQKKTNIGKKFMIDIDDEDLDDEDLQRMENLITWKRASQLRLNENISRGLSFQYEDSIDKNDNKWINRKQFDNTVDFIDELVSDSPADTSEYGEEDTTRNSVLKSSNNYVSKRRSNLNNVYNKLEVSFNLPDEEEEEEDVSRTHTLNSNNNNVTNVSQLIDDITFSQTHKKLISTITESIASNNRFVNLDWDAITDINLSNHELFSLKDLDHFLPNLRALNVANNSLKFLQGISEKILALNLSNNTIENISSFDSFHDLQLLNLQNNNLNKIINLNHLIHLTDLNISNNQLESMDGLNELSNLVRLNLSSNSIKGEINFDQFELKNLQELKLNDNKIKSISGLDNLSNLRVLNVNDNAMVKLHSNYKCVNLKKLLVRFNQLKGLEFAKFPNLRVLRLDGNGFVNLNGVYKLKNLEEISCKYQINSKAVEDVMRCHDIQNMNLSGNIKLDSLMSSQPYLNLNYLNMTAMNLSELPENFSKFYPNLRELNLNFNKLSSLLPLAKLTHLERLYLVSNNMKKNSNIISSLDECRNSIRVIDLRLNPINFGFYPYVFNPQEVSPETKDSSEDEETYNPIQLDTLDDIESFNIHYQSLMKSQGQKEWSERDEQYLVNIAKFKPQVYNRRLTYETIIVNYLSKLKMFDGSMVQMENRKELRNRLLK